MRTSALTLFSFSVIAATSAFAKIDTALLNERILSLRSLSAKTSCQDDVFANLNAKPQLNISIVFGYNDQRPYLNVLDGEERKILETGLLQPCTHQLDRLCGFTQVAPGQLRKGKVVLNLISSSVSGHDEWNRTVSQKKQYEASTNAEQGFATAIKSSDVVFYLGHARNGGGPDFFPPLLKENGNVFLKSYEQEQRGIKLLTANIAQSKTIKILGLFACDADKHFTDTLLKTRSDLSYILAGSVTLPTNMDYSMWGAFHSLLGKTCATSLKQNVTSNPQGYPVAPFRLIKP
jgi:hypothetical protein